MNERASLIYISLSAMTYTTYAGFYFGKNRKFIRTICAGNLVFSLIVLILGDIVFHAYRDAPSTYFYYICGTLYGFYRIYMKEAKNKNDVAQESPKMNRENYIFLMVTVIGTLLLVLLCDWREGLAKWAIDFVLLLQLLINSFIRIYLPLYLKFD